jgi:transcriptional regulator with XRE-family HTH domain
MGREDVAGEVRAWLGRRNRSRTSLCEQLGWSDPYLSRRLNGIVPFSTDDLAAIGRALDVSPDRFLVPETAAS